MIPDWSPNLLKEVADRTGLPARDGRWACSLVGVDLGIFSLAAVLRNAERPLARGHLENAVVMVASPANLHIKLLGIESARAWRDAVGGYNLSSRAPSLLKAIPWERVLRLAMIQELVRVDPEGRFLAGPDIDDAPSRSMDARALVALSWMIHSWNGDMVLTNLTSEESP
jgi:hypothetical protein